MEISNTQNSFLSYGINSTSSTQQTNNQDTTNSFDSYLTTSTEKSSNTNQETSKIVAFIDKYNGFSSLSPTDEKIFREILSDDKFTKDEANSLTYEQVEKIASLLLPSGLSIEEINSMPLVQSGVDLFATRATGDRKFNEAFYNTLKQIDSSLDANKLRSEVYNNLGQLYLEKELQATFQYEGSYLANPWEFENIQADFGTFIKNVINHHEEIISDPKVNSIAKKQFQEIVHLYDILQKNYNEIKNETKYA